MERLGVLQVALLAGRRPPAAGGAAIDPMDVRLDDDDDEGDDGRSQASVAPSAAPSAVTVVGLPVNSHPVVHGFIPNTDPAVEA